MKKAMILALSVLIVLALGSCKQLLDGSSGAKPGEGTVKFQFSPPGEDGIQPLHNIDDAHAVLVSIEDEEGNAVYTDESLLLYAFGGGYVSESLALAPGGYSLTAFLVVDDGGTAIFAAPVSGSARAYLVDTPLPLSFAVSRDAVATVAPEILDTEESEPEEFGYTSFEFTVVETFEFLLSVFEVSGAGSELTGAHLLVRAGSGQTLFDGPVAAETNVIEVQDGYDTYTVRVVKDGYDPWGETFTRAELGEYGDEPLVVSFAAGVAEWQEIEKLLASDGESSDYFGMSVSISGEYALVGAVSDDDFGAESGAAYVFKRDGASWSEEAKLAASDAAEGDWFGRCVSLSGEYALVGAVGDDDLGVSSGAAYVFKRDASGWIEEAKLTASDGDADDWFGVSVSLSGDYALVGAQDEEGVGALNVGAAYVFKRDGASWIEEAKLTAGDGHAGDRFGNSVSLSGGYALVGAYGDDDSGADAGAAYVFKRDGQSWSEEAKLTASDSAPQDLFGRSVSLSGQYALVGADYHDSFSGAAYVFKRDGTSWTEEAKLAPSSATAERFGFSVSLSGDHALVGSYLEDDISADAGAAYMFKRDGTSWSEEAKLTASDAGYTDRFGISVSLSGEYLLVGAYLEDDSGADAGAGYVFGLTE